MKNLLFRLKIIIKIFKYFGFRCRCNNCGIYVRRYLSITDVLPEFSWDLMISNQLFKASNFETFNLDNYFCPICMIPDKGRLIISFLESIDLKSRSLSILHLSPEIGIQKRLNKLFANHDYKISDFADESTLCIDITKVINSKFDIIICSHVLEHVEEDRLALKNLYDALNPEGIILFLVPIHKEIDVTIQDMRINSPKERKIAYGLEDHVRQYGYKDFQKLISSYFDLIIYEVETLDYLKLGLAKDSKLYIGLKN